MSFGLPEQNISLTNECNNVDYKQTLSSICADRWRMPLDFSADGLHCTDYITLVQRMLEAGLLLG